MTVLFESGMDAIISVPNWIKDKQSRRVRRRRISKTVLSPRVYKLVSNKSTYEDRTKYSLVVLEICDKNCLKDRHGWPRHWGRMNVTMGHKFSLINHTETALYRSFLKFLIEINFFNNV